MLATRENFPLLAELLAEQQRLDTPVARFSAAHDAHTRGVAAIAPQLIPLSKPGPGEQYAFEVDLDACTGCKSCVAACHSLNGLDDTETWRDVGLLVSGEPRHPFTQTVTTACHHCADPACLNGCPVLAYEKDPATGIVRHLDDQCIGCSYCVLKCPYDVPKYSARLGIVRKCDMCHGRLAAGEAPACAQACPTHAIRIVTVPAPSLQTAISSSQTTAPRSTATQAAIRTPQSANTSAGARRRGRETPPYNPFLPAAPDPSYTQPTTRYVSKRALPSHVVAADAATLRVQPTHWPLVVMLTLIPAAIGASGLAALEPIFTYYVINSPFSLGNGAHANFTYYVKMASVAIGGAGLVVSVLHLGQPRRAWRIFLGWRKSWLSREALMFGAWLGCATGAMVIPALSSAAALAGVIALFCSAMIYVDTRRQFWRFGHTAPRFFGTATVLGLAITLVCGGPPLLGAALVAATVFKLMIESRALQPLHEDRDTVRPARNTALLLSGPLGSLNFLRILCALVGGIMAPLLLATGSGGDMAAWIALVFSFAGELTERVLFFRAVDAPKMPGMPA